MMKDASSRPAYSFSSLPRLGWFGGIGWPAASNIAAEAAYCASDGSHMTATCVVSVCFNMLRKWARAMPPQPIIATRTGVVGVMESSSLCYFANMNTFTTKTPRHKDHEAPLLFLVSFVSLW